MVKASKIYNAKIEAGPGRLLRAEATDRNRGAILETLKKVLPAEGVVLEVGSGTGQHVAYFAPRLPGLIWRPSDRDPDMLASITAWAARANEAGAENLMAPLRLDVGDHPWPLAEGQARVVVCINMIHITPWSSALALMKGAARVLEVGGILYLYGAFRVKGRHSAPSNQEFDHSLRSKNPEWGVRDLEEVARAAANRGFGPPETIDMPNNNLSVVFRKVLSPTP